MAWRFEVLGQQFQESELTLDQYERLEEILGTNWHQIHPINSAKQAKTIAALMYSDRTAMSYDETLEKIGQSGALAFVDATSIFPNDEGEEPDPPVANESSPLPSPAS